MRRFSTRYANISVDFWRTAELVPQMRNEIAMGFGLPALSTINHPQMSKNTLPQKPMAPEEAARTTITTHVILVNSKMFCLLI